MFGLRDSFAHTGLLAWLAFAPIAAGWILATAVITGVTAVLRRD